MKNLIGIVGGGDNCALISQAEETGNTIGQSAAAALLTTNIQNAAKSTTQVQYAIVLCNSIGTPIEYKYVDFHPTYWCMNSAYIVVASKAYFYIWNYQAMVDSNSLKKQSFERLVFIDNPNSAVQLKTDDSSIVAVGPSIQVNFQSSLLMKFLKFNSNGLLK